MEHVETAVAFPTHVRALLSDHAASFGLAKGATLTDPIDRLDGSATAVLLQFPPPSLSQRRL